MRATKARTEILLSPHFLHRCYAPDILYRFWEIMTSYLRVKSMEENHHYFFKLPVLHEQIDIKEFLTS